MMKITTVLLVLLLAILDNLWADQYKANGEITINTLEEWQNTDNWIRIGGGSGYPNNNDEIILTSNARVNLDFNLRSNNLNVYLTFEDDGFLQIKSNGALFVLGTILMDRNNVEMKVYGDLEVEDDFQLDNGNLFVKDGGSLYVNGDFLRTNIGSGQFEIGGETTSFSVGGDFDDQHNAPYIYNSPSLNVGGSCSTKSGNFCDVYLPVTLVSFNVFYKNGNAILNWSTASELNNKSFEVYKSIDLIQWELIGELEGQGNSNTTHHYEWIDKDLNGSRRNYYQLHQVDFDGKREVFETLVLGSKSHPGLPQVMISTNSISSGENIRILYTDEPLSNRKVYIIYADGRRINCTNISDSLISNHLFSKGINLLLITNGREKYTFKILK